MEQVVIRGEARSAHGRSANQRLREREMLPAVIYGHGEPPVSVSVSARDALAALQQLARVIELDIDGKKQQLLIKDVQYDHLQRYPIHLDLMRFDTQERVHVKVPFEFRGTPAGAAVGGVLIHVMNELDVECTAANIPGAIRVKVEALELGQSLHVREIELPEGVTTRHNPEDVVAVCRPPRGGPEEAAPAEGEAASEPEVIKRGKADEEGAEGKA